MNDLISRSELMDELRSLRVSVKQKEDIYYEDIKDTILRTIIRIISEQPTVCDLERVIKQLEEEKKQYNKSSYNANSTVMVRECLAKEQAMSLAIRIVKDCGTVF